MVKLVLVCWKDAHVPPGSWMHLDELKDDGTYDVNTIGFLLEPAQGGKKNHVSICQSWGQDDYVDSILHIPIKMVKKTIVLYEEAKEMHRQDIQSAVNYLTRVTPRGDDDQQRLVNLIERMQSSLGLYQRNEELKETLHGRQK
jgi:hypothetical protein